MLRVLFIHQNLPGQFRRLIRYLQTRPDVELVAIGEEAAVAREKLGPKLRTIGYPKPDGAGEKTHHYLKDFEACVRRGQTVTRVCVELKKQGWIPDVVICHPGWGEGLFVKDVFPRARLVVFCEFWWAADGLDVGFDPEYPASYGRRSPEGVATYREALCAELGDSVDWSPVHFLGKLPYASYRTVLQVSSLHIYLTYPFVLSWSVLEAMAVGVPVLGSDTAPVREVIRDGENGYLTGFFDSVALADRALELIARRDQIAAVGLRGRETVLRNYDFESVGLPAYLELLKPLRQLAEEGDR